LLDLGLKFDSRDLDKQPLSEAELDKLVGARDYQEFLNPRNELYREHGMAEKPPSRPDALKLMSRNPNLIRRPVLVYGSQIVIGFDESAYRNLAKMTKGG
jgi:arsenate reductase-like glutaredoxin family protein